MFIPLLQYQYINHSSDQFTPRLLVILLDRAKFLLLLFLVHFHFHFHVQSRVPQTNENDEMSTVGSTAQTGKLLSDLRQLGRLNPDLVVGLHTVTSLPWVADIGPDDLEFHSLADEAGHILLAQFIVLGLCLGHYLDVSTNGTRRVDKEGRSDEAIGFEDGERIEDPVIVKLTNYHPVFIGDGPFFFQVFKAIEDFLALW